MFTKIIYTQDYKAPFFQYKKGEVYLLMNHKGKELHFENQVDKRWVSMSEENLAKRVAAGIVILLYKRNE